MEDAKEPRDSGCFESSENLENGREEPKIVEEETNKESSEQEEASEQQEEKPTEQLDTVQEQLEELTVNEGS